METPSEMYSLYMFGLHGRYIWEPSIAVNNKEHQVKTVFVNIIILPNYLPTSPVLKISLGITTPRAALPRLFSIPKVLQMHPMSSLMSVSLASFERSWKIDNGFDWMLAGLQNQG